MADRFYGYQYDTNPRKLNSDYEPYNKRYPKNKEPVKTTKKNYNNNTKNKIVNDNEKSRVNSRNKRKTHEKIFSENEEKQVVNKVNNVKSKLKIVMFLVAGFSVLFAISYQNSLINESFNRKEQYKKEMEALSKTNQQMEVSIENSLNLNTIEQEAKDKVGMQKLSNDQKIYVRLPKQDYVAPASEQIVIEEEQNLFQKIFNFFVK